MTLFSVGLIGLFVGSFLNVLVYRYQKLQTIVAGRSACPHCGHTLAWFDLVPLLSYVLLLGKCRYCKKSISAQYPIVELLSALLAMFCYRQFGLTLTGIATWVALSLLLVVAVIDLYHYLIPDLYVQIAIIASFIALFSRAEILSLDPVWAVVLAGGGLAFLVLVSGERWMGMGDIGLGVTMGLLVGLKGTAVGLGFAFIAGALVGLGLLFANKKSFKDMVPFGPFLVAATIFAVGWGQNLADWYFDYIGFY